MYGKIKDLIKELQEYEDQEEQVFLDLWTKDDLEIAPSIYKLKGDEADQVLALYARTEVSDADLMNLEFLIDDILSVREEIEKCG